MEKKDLWSKTGGISKSLESDETLVKATMYSVNGDSGMQDHYIDMSVIPKKLDGRCPSQVVVRYHSKCEQEDFFNYSLKDSKISEAEALPSKMMRDLGLCFVHVIHMN